MRDNRCGCTLPPQLLIIELASTDEREDTTCALLRTEQHTLREGIRPHGVAGEHRCVAPLGRVDVVAAANAVAPSVTAANVIPTMLHRPPRLVEIAYGEGAILHDEGLTVTLRAAQENGFRVLAEQPKIASRVHEARGATGLAQRVHRAIDGVALGDAPEIERERGMSHCP